jgi:hypothetical protein
MKYVYVERKTYPPVLHKVGTNCEKRIKYSRYVDYLPGWATSSRLCHKCFPNEATY